MERYQHTLVSPITLEDREPYGGTKVRVNIEPADIDTGIIFATSRGQIKANLDNASYAQSAIRLESGRAKVDHVEHVLATLYSMGVDNAIINLGRKPELTFAYLTYRAFQAIGQAAQSEVFPTSSNRELGLCQLIKETGLTEQSKPARIIRIPKKIGDEYLWLEPCADSQGLIVQVQAKYGKPNEKEFTTEITPQIYESRLARSRPYARHIDGKILDLPLPILSTAAKIINWEYGIGHAFSKEAYLIPPRSPAEWDKAQLFPCEIARHSVVDRLGALALLGVRFDHTKAVTRKSGHKEDLEMLREFHKEIIAN